jgi:hypothetical protein
MLGAAAVELAVLAKLEKRGRHREIGYCFGGKNRRRSGSGNEMVSDLEQALSVVKAGVVVALRAARCRQNGDPFRNPIQINEHIMVE